jgi:hypothetical protein
MARQMERHIRCNHLLTVFQSRFCWHHSTAAAVLKVTEDIWLSMEDEQVTVLLLLDGLKLNPIKSQLIVISRCRVDIPPPTLLIGSDVIKVVPKVNNLGFVLNERRTDHFKKVCHKVYWILRSLRPHAYTV